MRFLKAISRSKKKGKVVRQHVGGGETAPSQLFCDFYNIVDNTYTDPTMLAAHTDVRAS